MKIKEIYLKKIECKDVVCAFKKSKNKWVMKWARLTWDHRFLQMMHALYIPSLWVYLGKFVYKIGTEYFWAAHGDDGFSTGFNSR